MRILITGGFGFIGGWLAQHLQQAGHIVLLGSRYAVAPVDWLPQAELVHTDWSNGSSLEQICKGVDVVIHAAGMNAGDCAADPVAAMECNGLFTARLVLAATTAKVKRFIYLSTAHVYASPLVGSITEETCPRNLHPYATSHLAGENAVLSANERCEIEGIVLRLSNAYGAPVHKNVNCWMLLVNDLCRQAVESGKMVLKTNGLQRRDFIAMSEVCHIIGHISTCSFNFSENPIINIGSGTSTSVLEMGQLIQQRCAAILHFKPTLDRTKMGENEQYEMLEYRSNGLVKIGLSAISDKGFEIDNLLRFCQTAFMNITN
jgi:UDP-glucose 4-epimerase